MWGVFKFVNFFWLLASTYIWITSLIPMMPLLVLVNCVMIICMNFLDLRIEINHTVGRVLLAIIGLVIWSIYVDGVVMGVITGMMYMPVLYLIQLPYDKLKDLLGFVTKWYAVLLVPALILYWLSLFVSLPAFGRFVHPNYEPYINYIFYIKTTYDYGTFERFNAFFLEPGHQALCSSFLMMANQYRFKQCPWLIVLAAGVIFSFSLAGYLLAFAGFVLLKVNNLFKLLLTIGCIVAFFIGVQIWSGGDNALNELIVERLEYDESKGIKGNNRFFNNTDAVYKKAEKNGDLWSGVSGKANMELIGGAGFKIYILKYGLIGVAFALLFYLGVIPPNPNYRYSISFLIVLILCFMQRSYPNWYSWMFPYVVGIYLAKGEKHGDDAVLDA